MPFTHNDLQSLVNISGAGLREVHDRIENGMNQHKPLYENNDHAGILLLYHELYYEFVIAQSLICEPSFPFRIGTQIQRNQHPYDLGLYETQKVGSLAALGEIKCWWEAEETYHQEITGMKKDLDRLNLMLGSENALCSSAFLLVITNSPPEKVDVNISWLRNEALQLAGEIPSAVSQFPIMHKNEENLLLLLAFLLTPNS